MTYPFYVLDPITGAPIISDPLDPRRLPQHINTNHNLMLHEQLFPAANRITGYIIQEVALDRLSRYGIRFFIWPHNWPHFFSRNCYYLYRKSNLTIFQYDTFTSNDKFLISSLISHINFKFVKRFSVETFSWRLCMWLIIIYLKTIIVINTHKDSFLN